MLKCVQNIRDKIVEQKNALIYVQYRGGEFLQTFIEIPESCPVRDEIWVEKTNHLLSHRAVRYGICRVMKLVHHHLAYQPAVGHSLRHAGLWCKSFFYPYSVPTGQHTPPVSIEIEDIGPGIPDEIKDKILQAFFTTKKGTQGTGLGLSITNDIVKAHGGEMDIESKSKLFT